MNDQHKGVHFPAPDYITVNSRVTYRYPFEYATGGSGKSVRVRIMSGRGVVIGRTLAEGKVAWLIQVSESAAHRKGQLVNVRPEYVQLLRNPPPAAPIE